MASDFAAGWFGGCAGVVAGHPFDTIKVRLQCPQSPGMLQGGMFQCFRNIVKTESARGLYKGMASPMCGVALLNAVIFGVESNVHHLVDQKTYTPLQSHVIAGMTAGFAQSFIACPVEMAKTRMQLEGRGQIYDRVGKNSGQNFSGSIDCMLKTYRREGVRGLYRGMGVTMLRDSTGFAVYFGAYYTYCQWLSRWSSDGSVGILGNMVAGGFSGVTSWLPNYALDVINSRMKADGADGQYKYSGYKDCIRQAVKNEGYTWMHRGIASCALRGFPVNAATFGVVELIQRAYRTKGPLTSDLTIINTS